MPGCPEKGPIVLQHHGGYNEKKKEWGSASALIQFRNIKIKELPGKEAAGEKGAEGTKSYSLSLWQDDVERGREGRGAGARRQCREVAGA